MTERAAKGPIHTRRFAVIGLGYVGLPLAVALARAGGDVIGFDVDPRRVAELQSGRDRTREVEPEDLARAPVRYTTDRAALTEADTFIVTVPTPIDEARRPDLTAVSRASETVGAALRPGGIVVYESTVYPGVTEEICGPILARASGLTCGVDFTLGYSPERVNPGDKAHRLETIQKVVSGQTPETLEILAEIYGAIVPAGIHRAATIRVAEAAKVLENVQRDINIALMNELSVLCHAMAIDTADVLAAARTKWNFLPFTPGLVGGHCIGVDPYYLTHKAETLGHHAEIILAGRRINDQVGARIARETIRLSAKRGTPLRRAIVLGLTFKENVPDLRNSKVIDIIRTLQDHAVEVAVHDPHADAEEAAHEYGVTLHPLDTLDPADAVILAVPHADLLAQGWPLITSLLRDGVGVVLDVKSALPREDKPEAVDLWRL